MVKTTEFMMSVAKKLETPRVLGNKTKTLAPTTIDLYVKTLASLNGGAPYDDLKFLSDTATIRKRIDAKPCNSRKMLYATLLTILAYYPNAKQEKVYRKGFEAAKTECLKIDPNIKTEKEKANWMTWPEVLDIYGMYKEAAEQMEYLTRLNAPNYRTMLRYMILSLYVLLPPGRSLDYVAMYVMPPNSKNQLTDDRNWIDLRNKTLVFNKFKTVKDMGQEIVSYKDRPDFEEALNRFLKFNPDRHDTHPYKFLVHKNGSEISTSKQLHEILNQIFAPKKISSTMLRHIYLSSKYDVAEMAEDAKLMRHSIEQQKEYLKI